jgi:hypothetical protein
MRGFLIRITKAKLDSYWYAGLIGNEYWTLLEENPDNHMNYCVIFEGIIPNSGHGTKWVNFDDCEVIKESYIRIEKDSHISVIEI